MESVNTIMKGLRRLLIIIFSLKLDIDCLTLHVKKSYKVFHMTMDKILM